MEIIQPDVSEFPELTELWERSLRSTHQFMTDADIRFYRPWVQKLYLYEEEVYAVRMKSGAYAGFVGLALNEDDNWKVELLFVDPAWHGHGLGHLLLSHAYKVKGKFLLDVNEQNTVARSFYERCGFEVIGRSELDDEGRPFPMLQLRLNHPEKLLSHTKAFVEQSEKPKMEASLP